ENDAAGVELCEGRGGARADGVVARERVRDADAELDPFGREQRAGHVDPDVLPEHLRIDDPGAVVARLLGELHAVDEVREVLGQEVCADLHVAVLSAAKAASSVSVSASVFTWPQPTRIIS